MAYKILPLYLAINLLTDISALENIYIVTGTVTFRYCIALTSLSSLSSLTYIGGSLKLHGKYALNSLTGLEMLNTIQGETV